jgi:hypothetical protein
MTRPPRAARLLDLTAPYRREDITVSGQTVQALLGDAVSAIPVVRSMSEPTAVTLQVIDPDHDLLRRQDLLGEDRLARGVTLEVDGLRFTLSEIDKTDDGEDLVFLTEAVADLRRFRKRIRASRGQRTRAQFATDLARRAGVPLFAVDRDERQPVAELDQQDMTVLRRARRETEATERENQVTATGALDAKADEITVKGRKANRAQRRNMEIVLRVCDEEDAPPRARLACITAPIGESGYLSTAVNPTSGAAGVFQLLPSTQRAFGIGQYETAKQARRFLRGGFTSGKPGNTGAIELARKHPEWSVGKLVEQVEGSGVGGAFYDRDVEEGRRIQAAWSPGSERFENRVSTPDRTYVRQYQFTVEAGEDYWEALVRLAEQVRWRIFPIGNGLIFANDLQLAELAPTLELQEGRDGCERIRFLWTAGQRIDEVTALIRGGRWQAAPGSVVLVTGEGPADGRYLVREVQRDLLDAGCELDVTLGKPQRPRAEPASTVATNAGRTASASAADSGGVHDGRWKLAPGANRPGVPLTKAMQAFLDRMATFYDGTLIVTTGTDHDRLTTNGAVSAHWGGNGVDFGDGLNGKDAMPRICVAALRAAGEPLSKARRLASSGTPYTPFGGVQVLWKTDEYHLDHVHVGL